MATNQISNQSAEPNRDSPSGSDVARSVRARSKFGLGVGLSLGAVLLLLASLVLVWFGIFPGLVALVVALPMAVAGVRLVRRGEPATITETLGDAS